MKMKELGPRGGRVPGTPLDPPIVSYVWEMNWLLYQGSWEIIPKRTSFTPYKASDINVRVDSGLRLWTLGPDSFIHNHNVPLDWCAADVCQRNVVNLCLSLAGLHVLGNFWKLGKIFKNLGTFCFWTNFSKNWAKMNIFWANCFFPTNLNWPINLFSSLHDKNAVLYHLKFLRKFYPKKICPIHAVQPLLHCATNSQESSTWLNHSEGCYRCLSLSALSVDLNSRLIDRVQVAILQQIQFRQLTILDLW